MPVRGPVIWANGWYLLNREISSSFVYYLSFSLCREATSRGYSIPRQEKKTSTATTREFRVVSPFTLFSWCSEARYPHDRPRRLCHRSSCHSYSFHFLDRSLQFFSVSRRRLTRVASWPNHAVRKPQLRFALFSSTFLPRVCSLTHCSRTRCFI